MLSLICKTIYHINQGQKVLIPILIYIRYKFKKNTHKYNHVGHICPRRKHPQLHFPPSGPMYRENTDSGYITPGKQVQMTKTAIRKRLHFTDERHDLAAAIRKYGVFADGPALPVRNTGFWARNGVSRHGKASVSAKPARDTDFWTENGVSLHGETAQSAKTRSRLVNEGRMRVGGQLRFHGCDFLLSLRPFFEKLRSVV